MGTALCTTLPRALAAPLCKSYDHANRAFGVRVSANWLWHAERSYYRKHYLPWIVFSSGATPDGALAAGCGGRSRAPTTDSTPLLPSHGPHRRPGCLPLRRVLHAPEEEDRARRVVANHIDERVVGLELDDLLNRRGG